jgi:hypothetical protein
MAQHDYVIDNQSFPATRTDINNALLAISSTNSGTSAPSTTYASQLWYDTSENKLYIRNEDNDAWIPLFLLDQSNDKAGTLATEIDIEDVSGTNTAGTALTIKGGAGTGTGAGGSIIFQTADGGSSGSSVNAHATRVTITDDGSVLINSTAARSAGGYNPPALQVESTNFSSLNVIENQNGTSGAGLMLAKSRGTTVGSNTIVQDGDTLGTIRFTGADGTDLRPIGAEISAVVSGTPSNNDMPASLVFGTTADGAQNSTERMRIDSSGNVGINTSSPAQKLHLQTGGTTYMRVENTAISTVTDFGTDSTGSIIINRSAKPMRFFTDSAERLRVDASGNVLVGTTTAYGQVVSESGSSKFQFASHNTDTSGACSNFFQICAKQRRRWLDYHNCFRYSLQHFFRLPTKRKRYWYYGRHHTGKAA